MTPGDVEQLLGWTALLRAAARGALDDVRRLHEEGASLEAKTVDGWRPLFVAALAGHAGVVLDLLARGASREPIVVPPDHTAGFTSTMTLAEVACRSGDAATVRAVGGPVDLATFFLAAHARLGHRLLKITDAGHSDGDMIGYESDWPEQWGIDTDVVELDADTMALLAPGLERPQIGHLLVGGVLMVPGRDIAEQPYHRFGNPLPPAGFRGPWRAPFAADLAPLLLGEDVQPAKHRAKALLLGALKKGQLDVARILAPLVGTDADAFCAAVDLDDVDLADRLLPELNPRWPWAPGGMTPLGYAAAWARPLVVNALLARGAQVDRGTHNGLTPLMLAVEHAGPAARDIVTALLEHRAVVNVPDAKRPALLRAVAHGDVEIVDRLLRAGADVHATDGKGRTALDHARPGDHDIIELLVGRGAVRRP
jgi:hypothetical protein